jgi:hypothetical protein
MVTGAHDPAAVFLNVPFDPEYEQLFVSLVCAIVALGRRPACVLEIPDGGEGRLERLLDKIETCGASIHDLSRVALPVRFNMPFELGLTCALARRGGLQHKYYIFDEKEHQLDQHLSDIKGHDTQIHKSKVGGVINAVLQVLRRDDRRIPREVVITLHEQLRLVMDKLKQDAGEPTVFSRTLFLELVAAATSLAVRAGLIEETSSPVKRSRPSRTPSRTITEVPTRRRSQRAKASA